MSDRSQKKGRRSPLQAVFDLVAASPVISRKGRRLLMRGLSHLSPNLVAASAYGPTMRARLEDATNRAALYGEYGRTVYDAIVCLAPGDAFIDVGANAGVWSLVAGDKVGPDGLVIAFEPQRLLAEELRANARLNDLENLYVFDFAIGDVTRPSNLCEVDKDHSGLT